MINKNNKSFFQLFSLLFLVMAVSVGVALASGNSQLFTQSKASGCPSSGQVRCNGKESQVCAGGSWRHNTNCSYGCSNGKCNKSTILQPTPTPTPTPKSKSH